MKKIVLSFALCALVGLPARLAATTFTVNNNNPSPGQYTAINDAIDAAAEGDTILIVGSPYGHDYVNVNKNNLTLIGAGHRPQKTPMYATLVYNIHFMPNLNGFKIQGVDFNSLNANTADNADNITVEFCLIRTSINYWKDCNNWTIKNCVFLGTNGCSIYTAGTSGRTNILISNNIFGNNNGPCALTNNSGVIISNNIFLRGGSGDDGAFSGGVYNALISNNIFYETTPTYTSDCIFNNNLTFNATNNTLPPSDCPTCSGSGNIVNQDPLFTNYVSGQNFSYDYDFTLQAGSPGKNAGADGTDLGVYGANNIFSETGEPPIPVVRTVTIINPSTAQGAMLNVNVTISNPDPDQ